MVLPAVTNDGWPTSKSLDQKLAARWRSKRCRSKALPRSWEMASRIRSKSCWALNQMITSLIRSPRHYRSVWRKQTKLAGSLDPSIKITGNILLGSPRSVILEEADRWNADLIVIGSHGYGAWQRFLLGSVSQSVVSHAKCSVEVVRRRGREKSKAAGRAKILVLGDDFG